MGALRLGSRGSPLALYQARAVAGALATRGIDCEIVVIRTSGDRLAASPGDTAAGKHLFVKEIEDSLLAGDIDLAVHSSKDMPAVLPDGLVIGGVLPREDARDALVLPDGADQRDVRGALDGLRSEPRIGTGSVRRAAQLARLRPDARFLPVRGNVDTRLHKLDAGDYDALVLAAAGLRRLGHGDRIAATLQVERCVPAPGQGIIAVEIRRLDGHVADAVAAIADADAAIALRAERTVVERLGGGCQLPIGAYARRSQEGMTVTSIVISPDGSRTAWAEASGPADAPEAVGASAADHLLAAGAQEILAEARRALAGADGEPG